MLPLKTTAFDATPLDYSNIQSELERWKNLTFSFDMGDEQNSKPPSESHASQRHSHDQSIQDAVLLAQFAEATRHLQPPTIRPAPPQGTQINIPLDPSLLALVQALQSVQSHGITPGTFPPSHSGQGAQHTRQPQHAPSQIDNHGALFQILQQSSSSANMAPPQPQPQYHGYSSDSMNSFLDQFTDYNHGAPNQQASGSSSSSSGAAAVASTSASSPGNVDEGFDDKRRRNTAASARFRIKKKQRTLNLERSVSDLKGRADELEREASDLRRENGWLKEIIMLKSSRLNLTPDTVSSSMWDHNNNTELGDEPEEDGDQGGESSDSDYVDNAKRKGKGKAKK